MKRVLFKKDYYFILLMVMGLPMVMLAKAEGLFGILELGAKFIGNLIPLVIGLAVLYFLWGVLGFIQSKDAEEQKQARMTMLSGIVVLFVMVSIWGLVGLLSDTFNLSNNTPDVPSLPGFRN